MSRWDETNFDKYGYGKSMDHEEARLIKKFDDYRDLERREIQKRNHQNNTKDEKKGANKSRLLFLTIIQAVSIVGVTAAMTFLELANSKMMNFILLGAVSVLAAEIVIISNFSRKKSGLKERTQIRSKTKSEFDFI